MNANLHAKLGAPMTFDLEVILEGIFAPFHVKFVGQIACVK